MSIKDENNIKKQMAEIEKAIKWTTDKNQRAEYKEALKILGVKLSKMILERGV